MDMKINTNLDEEETSPSIDGGAEFEGNINFGAAFQLEDDNLPDLNSSSPELTTSVAKSIAKKASNRELSSEHLLIKSIIDHGRDTHKLLDPESLRHNLELAERHRVSFSDPDLEYIYGVIKGMAKSNGGSPDFDRLRKKIMADIDADTRREHIDAALDFVQASKFKASKDILIGAQYAETVRAIRNDLLGEAMERILAKGNEILVSKVKIGTGKNARELHGALDSQNWVVQEMSAAHKKYANTVEIANTYDSYSESDANTLISELNQVKDSGVSLQERLMPWAIPSLNERLKGIGHNEFIAVCAYTSQLKTAFCINQAARTALAGFNVLYFCYEQVVREITPKFLSLHAQHPKFKKKYPGKYGSLTSDYFNPDRTPETRAFDNYIEDVIKSFNSGDAGRLLIESSPTMSVQQIWQHAEAIDAKWKEETGFGVDLVVIDYLGIVPDSGKGYRDFNADLNTKVLEARKMTNAFAGGRGVTVMTPWQVSRGAYEKAIKSGGELDATSPSNANELERSVSSAIGIFYDEEHRKLGRAKISWLKSRNAGNFEAYPVAVDPKFCWFEDIRDPQEGLMAGIMA